jgi:prepilin-type processing-associated H-X9-DG protein
MLFITGYDKNMKVAVCPQVPPFTSQDPTFNTEKCYAMPRYNSVSTYYGNVVVRMNPTGSDSSSSVLIPKRAKSASNMLIMGDSWLGDGSGNQFYTFDYRGFGSATGPMLSMNHGESGNFGFLDGHMRSIKGKEIFDVITPLMYYRKYDHTLGTR